VASIATRTLWVADAYFVALPLYVQSLRAAAEDGVDVRLLVPGSSDVPVLRPLTRAGYRPLLKSGVRVFEWNGPMMHAKTAVADGRWGRVGSTNLNIASWMGNWELDVAVEHEGLRNAEPTTFVGVGICLMLLAMAMILWPLIIAVPASVIAIWLGLTLVISGIRRLRQRRRRRAAAPPDAALKEPSPPPRLTPEREPVKFEA
jgi:phosphatidylserine/phosphatidylglycerophosphate/cardiolipin synthase-like enzyme